MPVLNSNPALPTMPLPFDWQGNPMDSKGFFINLNHPFTASFKEVLKWQLGEPVRAFTQMQQAGEKYIRLLEVGETMLLA